MQKLSYLLDLESLVTRLTDLPKFLGSASKKDRKYGKKVFEDIILPAVGEMISFNSFYGELYGYIDPLFQFGKYCTLVNDAQYEKASKFAIDWLRLIKEEISIKKEFGNFYS